MEIFGEDYETQPVRVEVVFHDDPASLERMGRMVRQAVDLGLVDPETRFGTRAAREAAQKGALAVAREGVLSVAASVTAVVRPGGALVLFPPDHDHQLWRFESLSLIEVNKRLRPVA